MLDNSIEGVVELTFSVEADEFGRVKVIDLKPEGRTIPVTDDNKLEYVQLLCEHHMSHGIQQQLKAFLQGFHELVPADLIAPFDANELELLISGLPEIDIDDLKRNTEYQGYVETSPVVRWFWKCISEMTQEQKAWFLQFVTGTSQVPLEGFKGLMGMRGPQKFSIHRAFGEERLPTAHTCFNHLDIPDYPSEEVLQKKLMQAICEAHEGFGFV
jgi:E3 ubiquitin-protein ligase HUWE1